MTVLRPVLVGLGVGAAIAFLIALLSPRRVLCRGRYDPSNPVRP